MGGDDDGAPFARETANELEDVAAVREWAVSSGLASACVIAGGSWGGYLTLLGLGTQPEAWACGVAAVPVADPRRIYLKSRREKMSVDNTSSAAMYSAP